MKRRKHTTTKNNHFGSRKKKKVILSNEELLNTYKDVVDSIGDKMELNPTIVTNELDIYGEDDWGTANNKTIKVMFENRFIGNDRTHQIEIKIDFDKLKNIKNPELDITFFQEYAAFAFYNTLILSGGEISDEDMNHMTNLIYILLKLTNIDPDLPQINIFVLQELIMATATEETELSNQYLIIQLFQKFQEMNDSFDATIEQMRRTARLGSLLYNISELFTKNINIAA